MTPKHSPLPDIQVRPTRREDIPKIIDLCRQVYASAPPWGADQLESHLAQFADGQLVAVAPETNDVVGMAASLIVTWDDYHVRQTWSDFTGRGYFTNHDPQGRTLYGAEVMVSPKLQGRGIGKKIYAARREITRRLKLRRIRARARLRGYGQYADRLTPEDYVKNVIAGEIGDPTLTFQLKQHFRVIAVARHYLQHDPASQGHAAVIEWINHDVAQRQDYKGRPAEYAKHRKPKGESPS